MLQESTNALVQHTARKMPELKARSAIVAMVTSPLSEAQTARLLVAECHRIKSEFSSALCECVILGEIEGAEGRVLAVSEGLNPDIMDFLKIPFARRKYLNRRECEAERKMGELEDELARCEPLLQLSVLGTMTELERQEITSRLEAEDFKDGTVFMKQGWHGDALYIIAQGEVSCKQQLDPDELVVKSDYLLTKQPCECTLTAVGPVKVLVLHRAREQLAALRAS